MRMMNLLPRSQTTNVASTRPNAGIPMLALQSELNRAFADFWRGLDLPMLNTDSGSLAAAANPQIDIRETGNAIEVTAELPGLEEKDVDVRITDGTLIIRGEKKSEQEKKDDGYVLRERHFGRFERILPLPEGIDPDSAVATFKNGVLAVTVNKTKEAQAAVKRIPVRANKA
jgi:HSP20 family protein